MTDVFSKQKRSEVMSRIRSRGNKATELVLARLLRQSKISGWRRQQEVRIQKSGVRSFRVRPDFVFRQARLAIFVDGCFWHGCPKHGTQPKGNRAFWKKKFARNKARDVLVTRHCAGQGGASSASGNTPCGGPPKTNRARRVSCGGFSGRSEFDDGLASVSQAVYR
jgi:DNA mismatch endonuclease (patch repair protein)